MVESYTITLENSAKAEDVRCVKKGLANYNFKSGGFVKAEELVLFVKELEGNIVGGLLGFTFGAWFHIQTLWVDENIRKAGLGKQLLEKAEGAAVKRGCRVANVETFSFQAPEFYRKMNYELFGELNDIGNKHKVLFFRKILS
jgi:GNAT superfamily N-acetyltransferase